MDRSLARRILLAAFAIGVLAEVVLDGPALGLNLPILTATVLAAAWLFRRPGRAPDPLDAWLPRLSAGPGLVRRRAGGSVRVVARPRRGGGVHRCIGRGVLGARGDAAIRDGGHDDGRVGARERDRGLRSGTAGPDDRPRPTVPGGLHPGSGLSDVA